MEQVLPFLPNDVIGIILSFSEDGMIRSCYRMGRLVHRIHWKHESRYELEAMILVRRIFPEYWCYDADNDERYIYVFMKAYFKGWLSRRDG